MDSNYFIGLGTGIVKCFKTLDDMISFHKNMPSVDRHFCKLYDGVLKRYAWGCIVQYGYDDPENWYIWR